MSTIQTCKRCGRKGSDVVLSECWQCFATKQGKQYEQEIASLRAQLARAREGLEYYAASPNIGQYARGTLSFLDASEISLNSEAPYSNKQPETIIRERCPACGLYVIGTGDNRSCVDPSCFCGDSEALREREKPRQDGGEND